MKQWNTTLTIKRSIKTRFYFIKCLIKISITPPSLPGKCRHCWHGTVTRSDVTQPVEHPQSPRSDCPCTEGHSPADQQPNRGQNHLFLTAGADLIATALTENCNLYFGLQTELANLRTWGKQSEVGINSPAAFPWKTGCADGTGAHFCLKVCLCLKIKCVWRHWPQGM